MLGLLSALFLGSRAVGEACKKEIPAEYHRNYVLENADLQKVGCGQMTMGEYNRRLKSGYYSGEPVRTQADDFNDRWKAWTDKVLAGDYMANL